MNTTVYLIRHSIRMNKDYIDQYNTTQDKTIKNEKIVLSVEGERRAEILCNEEELQNIDTVYASNCVRTLQTAKYMLERQNLKVNIDERFDERRVGIPNDNVVSDWLTEQYVNPDYKTVGGESQREVRQRFTEAFNEAIERNKGKRIAIFTHGYAMTFFIMTWCSFEYIKETDTFRLCYNGKELFNRRFNAPEVFKLELDEENNLIDFKVIEFDDLPLKDGLGR